MAIFKSIHAGAVIDAAITKVVDLASSLTGKGASLIAIEDVDGNYTSGDVEGALREAGNNKLEKTASPNKNLLHNWDFRNPVNQRGASSYSTGYSIDRWILNGGTLILGSGGIKFSATYVLFNISEKSYDTTKLYTFSYLDGNDNVHSAVIDTFGVYHFVDSKLNVQISGAAIYLESKDSDNIIKAVKLELGSVSTLANDPPADYGEQLALCQRYCLGILPFMFVRASSYTSSYIDFHIPVPVTMRTTPSISVDGMALYNVTGTIQSGFTFSVPVHTRNGFLLRATKTAHGLTDAYMGTGSLTVFSADL